MANCGEEYLDDFYAKDPIPSLGDPPKQYDTKTIALNDKLVELQRNRKEFFDKQGADNVLSTSAQQLVELSATNTADAKTHTTNSTETTLQKVIAAEYSKDALL